MRQGLSTAFAFTVMGCYFGLPGGGRRRLMGRSATTGRFGRVDRYNRRARSEKISEQSPVLVVEIETERASLAPRCCGANTMPSDDFMRCAFMEAPIGSRGAHIQFGCDACAQPHSGFLQGPNGSRAAAPAPLAPRQACGVQPILFLRARACRVWLSWARSRNDCERNCCEPTGSSLVWFQTYFPCHDTRGIACAAYPSFF